MAEVKLTITDRDGRTREIHARVGQRLMHVVRDEVDMNVGVCGGVVSCGTCLVRLSAEWAGRIAGPSSEEAEMLEAVGGDELSRLSCQLELDRAADGMSATLVGID